MNAAPHGRGRGSELLLEHCAALARLDSSRPTPFERLEVLVGGDLAEMLVSALVRRAARPREAWVSY